MKNKSKTPIFVAVRRRKHSNFGKLIFFIFVVMLLLIGLSKIKGSNKMQLASGVVSPLSQTAVLGESINTSFGNDLEDYIRKIKNVDTENQAVVAINLETGEEAQLNSTKTFPAASLYKLWVMAVVYKQIEEGKLSLKTNLSKSIPELNSEFNLDKDSAEKTSGTVSETVEEALFKMITVSDNYSALLLVDLVGVNSIQKFLNENGFSNSHVSQNGNLPQTNASDTALFFYKLYNGELANSVTTSSMITLLSKQILNDKIPNYLPTSLIIAHKTGEIDDYSHDAGIIYTPDTRYILVVLAKSSSREVANEDIAEISKKIYEYFER